MSTTDPFDIPSDDPTNPSSPEYPQYSAPAPQPSRHRRAKRIAVLGTAGALVVGAVALGGVAVGEQLRPSTTASTGTSTTRQWQGGYGGSQGSSSQGLQQGGGFGGQGSSGSFGQGSMGQQQTQTQQSSNESTSDATSSQASGLVFISSTLTDGEARGTGIVLTSDGEIVTNHHVVSGATSIKVTIPSTGKTYTATYVGGNATTDVAVLQLQDASGLTTADVDTSAVTVGDTITAVGDANGDQGTLTAAPGKVTGVDDSITVSDEDGTQHRLTGLVKLDADIVSGDSGGAVKTSDGDVVAMNVAASSGSATVTGYAIPMSTVMSVVDQIESGTASSQVKLGYSGYLGIGISDSAVVAEVEKGSAADDAGLVAGDTITSVGGKAVTGGDQLKTLISSYAADDKVVIGWTTSSGATKSATVTLGSIVG